VAATLMASLAGIAMAKKAAAFLVPGMAPADVLNKASKGKRDDKELPLQTITAYDSENEDMSNIAGGGI